MADLKTGMCVLIFTYGFLISYHIMGSAKFFIVAEFDWRKALLGIFKEVGYCGFLFLIYLLPQYIDTSKLININLQEIINLVLFAPLIASIQKAYKKACELKDLDTASLYTSEEDKAAAEEAEALLQEIEDGEVILMEEDNEIVKEPKEITITVKGTIDYDNREGN